MKQRPTVISVFVALFALLAVLQTPAAAQVQLPPPLQGHPGENVTRLDIDPRMIKLCVGDRYTFQPGDFVLAQWKLQGESVFVSATNNRDPSTAVSVRLDGTKEGKTTVTLTLGYRVAQAGIDQTEKQPGILDAPPPPRFSDFQKLEWERHQIDVYVVDCEKEKKNAAAADKQGKDDGSASNPTLPPPLDDDVDGKGDRPIPKGENGQRLDLDPRTVKLCVGDRYNLRTDGAVLAEWKVNGDAGSVFVSAKGNFSTSGAVKAGVTGTAPGTATIVVRAAFPKTKAGLKETKKQPGLVDTPPPPKFSDLERLDWVKYKIDVYVVDCEEEVAHSPSVRELSGSKWKAYTPGRVYADERTQISFRGPQEFKGQVVEITTPKDTTRVEPNQTGRSTVDWGALADATEPVEATVRVLDTEGTVQVEERTVIEPDRAPVIDRPPRMHHDSLPRFVQPGNVLRIPGSGFGEETRVQLADRQLEVLSRSQREVRCYVDSVAIGQQAPLTVENQQGTSQPYRIHVFRDTLIAQDEPRIAEGESISLTHRYEGLPPDATVVYRYSQEVVQLQTDPPAEHQRPGLAAISLGDRQSGTVTLTVTGKEGTPQGTPFRLRWKWFDRPADAVFRSLSP